MNEDLNEIARQVAELDRAVESVRGEALSPNGAVHMEVDLYGAITGLRLSDFALERGPEQFARLVADCHRRAHEAAVANARRVHESVRREQASRGAW